VSGTALVVGATGAVALRLVERLLADGWTVVGLCRRPPATPSSARLVYVTADLFDVEACTRALRAAPPVSHVIYTARATHGETGTESIPENVAMLASTLDAVLPAARDLRHVHLVEGGKWYGLHLGPYPTPAREDDPRPSTPNFYHAQEDLLRERQQGQPWTWSASRPNILCDFAPGRARNLTAVVGVYAAILRELGQPLHFPGNAARWHALMEATDGTLLADAIRFLMTDARAANQAFNVSNGDVFRWERLWPRIAAHYGMRVGDVRHERLATFMRDKDAVWQRVVARFGLVPSTLDDVAAWPFGDFVFGMDHDIMSSTTRLREAGFHAVLDTEAMFLRQLAQYREARILP
jgi:nucleoside-diphosphate-sugar epimerase